jgi:hypothetical protein
MAKRYRLYEPEQLFLMPPSLREWLAEDHLAYFVSDLVDDLDLSEIDAVYEDEERGQPPYHPRMMVKVLIYAYCNLLRDANGAPLRTLSVVHDITERKQSRLSRFCRRHWIMVQTMAEGALTLSPSCASSSANRRLS